MTPRRWTWLLAAGIATLAIAPAAAQTVTRGPYLQIPTPTSIVVRWRTDVATDSRVRYGSAPGSLTAMADDPTATTEHEVAVTGLTPSTQYFYSIGTTTAALAGDDASHFFRTTPPVGTVQPVRIWVTGDGGFANADGQAVRDSFLTYNAGQTVDLWLLLGDNAYLVGSDSDYQAALFEMHADMLRRVPAWPTFGNHEALSSNSLTETGPYFDIFTLPRAGEAGGVPSGTEAYYSFDYANIHFIVLDSHFSDNSPGSPMLLWLEADLQATTADWVIAYWHHPPYSKSLVHDSDTEQREIDMRQNVLPVLEDYGVDLVLAGHAHVYERSALLDGHYGLSQTLTSAMLLDTGDGDPAGDGAYRKAGTGANPHQGAVYVTAGSSSQARFLKSPGHPAHVVGLAELGSLVLDVDGDVLTLRFLDDAAQVDDTFTIAKGVSACPATPRTGCEDAGRARLVLRDRPDDARDRLLLRLKALALPGADVGDPFAQTDLALCLYDASGALLGTSLPPGRSGALAPSDPPGTTTPWKATRAGFRYRDPAAAHGGVRLLRVKTGEAPRGAAVLRGKGPALGLPALPLTPPLTAQLVNVDAGKCWQATFTSARQNDAAKVVAVLP